MVLKNNRAWFLIAVVLLLLQSSFLAAAEIITSSVDDREYRYFELKNGLKVVVIHDPTTDKAAAALDVFVGSADNPKDRAGLAHFLEHMLFLGTEKYPEADEYQAFVKANGGGHNAFTATDNTNYFFDVSADALEPTLDRFAQFFISPLFTPEYVARERNAVHSEYTSKLKDDFRRSFDAFREIVNPEHSSAQFRVGNAETLADIPNDSVREDLIEFYQKHYSADNMALVVLGKQSLDELQKLVEKLFNDVPKRKVFSERKSVPLFKKDSLPMQLSIVPEQELRSLTLLFPIPNVRPYYRVKPVEYIANLIGHEGPGSIIDVLKKRNWVENLGAGAGLDDRFTSNFIVNIRLTQQGWQNKDQVIATVFAGIEQIKAQGIKPWRYQEQADLSELTFEFQEKQEPRGTVSFIAGSLHEYPAEEVLKAGFLYERYDARLIKRYLSFLNPENLFLQVTAPEVKTDTVSHFYQTPYTVKSLKGKPWSVDEEIAAELTLPAPNPFVPEKLSLLKNSDKPVKNIELTNGSLWFKTDTSFDVPRGVVNIRLLLPSVGSSIENSVMASVYTDMVKEAINSYSYPALLAGLHFTVSNNTRGLDLRIDGYNDKQEKLISEIVRYFSDFDLVAPQFDRVKQQLIRDWRNSNKDTPYVQLFSKLSEAVFTPQWSRADKADVLEAINREQIQQFSSKFFDDGEVRVLVYGNFKRAQAKKIAKKFDQLVDGRSGQLLAPAKVVQLDNKADWFWLAIDHPDEALIGYVQGHSDSMAEQAKMMLLQQLISASYFNELRTEQQLGYVVFASNAPYKKVPGLIFVVQSPSASVAKIQHSTETFVEQFAVESLASFEQHKKGLLVSLMEKPKNLNEQASYYWDSILREIWTLDYRELLAAEIENITFDELNQFLSSRLKDDPRWLWLAAAGSAKQPKDINWQTVQDIKSNSEAYIYP